ncbi:hypothetical protein BH11PLA1_BH11PLA1_16970 [soil metagenome]
MSVLSTTPSSARPSLQARIGALPRAAKWLGGLIIFVGLYFGVVEPVITKTHQWNQAADDLQLRTSRAASVADALTKQQAELDRRMLSLGRLKTPSTSADPQSALERRLSEIGRTEGVSEKRRNPRPAAPVAVTGLHTIGVDPLPRLERVAVEWQIECDTTHLMGVLSALESAPEVHAVSSVQIRKLTDSRANEGAGTLSATIVVETWYPAKGAGTAGAPPHRDLALSARTFRSAP